MDWFSYQKYWVSSCAADGDVKPTKGSHVNLYEVSCCDDLDIGLEFGDLKSAKKIPS